MKKQIFVINGGGAFETYKKYLSDLKKMKVTLELLRTKGWKRNLQKDLGNKYDVLIPQMPNAFNARYAEWKIWFEKYVPLLDKGVTFIGHSLGAIFLTKYLSENNYPNKILATFLVATPYNTKKQHPLVDFNLSNDLSKLGKQGGQIFLYHSKDDKVVPFSNLKSYQKALPGAHVKIFTNRQHFNQEKFPELVKDIKNL